MSDSAIFRFLTNDLLGEEKKGKETTSMTEEIVCAQGMDYNAAIGKILEKQQETLEKVRLVRSEDRVKRGGN